MHDTKLLVLSGISALALMTPVYAQQLPTSPVGASANNEIIVEARRRGENLQDVPVVINAVTAQTIDQLNLRKFDEITSVVPGLLMDPTGSVVGASSSMRGVRHDILTSGENGTIQYYLNDSPVPTSMVFQSMYDIGQIEVLRGPQGTLRGRATPSGSITLTTRQPDLSEAGGYASATVASASAKNINFGLNVPIIEDMLAVRVAGLHDTNRGNRVYSVNSDVKPKRETDSIRATVRFEPFDFLKFGFMYQGLDSKGTQFDQTQSFSLLDPTAVPSANAPDFGIITASDNLSTANTPRSTRQQFKYYNWNAEIEQFGQKVIYVGSRQVVDLTPITPSDVSSFLPANSFTQDVETYQKQKTHEIRLQNAERLFGMVDYVVGYFNTDYVAVTDITNPILINFAPPGFIARTPISAPSTSVKEKSFFGNLTVHLTEDTEISGGVRRISFDQVIPSLLLNGAPQPNSAFTFDNKATVYNASVKHRFNENLMAYASTGSSWRPPIYLIGNFTAAPLSPNELNHLLLEPETSKSYELGLKTNWIDNKLTVNVSYFHQDFKNYPTRPNGAGVYFLNYTNVGGELQPNVGQFGFISGVPVKVNGVEAEIAFRPSDNFSVSSFVNWAKSKSGNALLACTDALNNQTGVVGSDGVPDTRVPTAAEMQQAYGDEHLAQCPGGGQNVSFQPDWSGSVQAEYSLPVRDNAEAYLRGLVSWRGKSEGDPNNRFDQVGAYALLNLYTGLRDPDGAWELSFFAKNLTNAKKIVTRNDSAYQTAALPNALVGRYSGVTITAPREFGVNMRVAFGSR